MGSISSVQARALFTKKLVAVYQERTAPTGFLRSFFKVEESDSKEISIEVQRGTEKIAVDVERATEGNRNQFSRSSEKIFVPPYYKEYFDATELDFYDMLFTANGSVSVTQLSKWIKVVVEKLGMLQDKIERALELQCAQVLETGVVQLNADTNIDFKRKAGSMVALAGAALWDAGTSDPYKDLKDGATFIRQKGKAQGNIFNAIMGEAALDALLNNTVVKARADIRNFSLDQVRDPQRNSVGGTLHGEVSAGAYKFRIWTYPEYYDTEAATNLPYVADKKVIIIPDSPKFVLAFAAVPRLLTSNSINGANSISGQKGAFLVGQFVDERNTAHVIDIKSAGLAIPVGIDMIYTFQPLT